MYLCLFNDFISFSCNLVSIPFSSMLSALILSISLFSNFRISVAIITNIHIKWSVYFVYVFSWNASFAFVVMLPLFIIYSSNLRNNTVNELFPFLTLRFLCSEDNTAFNLSFCFCIKPNSSCVCFAQFHLILSNMFMWCDVTPQVQQECNL